MEPAPAGPAPALKRDTRAADIPGMTHNQQPQPLEPVRLNSRSPWQHRKAWASRLAGLDPIDAEQVALRVRQLLERPGNVGRILPA